MRRQFSIIIIFFVVFHFLLPCLYFLIYGFVNLYSDVQGYVGCLINIISLLGTLFIIKKMPTMDSAPLKEYNHLSSFFLVSLFITLYKFYSSGGYSGALEGSSHGTLISFLSLFFNATVSFFLVICLQKHVKHIYVWICLYVAVMTITGSRSAVLGVLLLFLYIPLFANYKSIYRKLKKILLVLTIVSPILFFYATSVRGEIDTELLSKIIIGRISFVELSMIPLQSKQEASMDQKVFEEKYSLNNQVKQVVNTVTPIDFFEYDVSPNQYFRQIFLGASERTVLDSYMSINMTLPVYFVMETNYVVGIFLTIAFLSFLFWIWVHYASNRYVFIAVLFSMYDFLYYFDWIMITQSIFSICLTLLALDVWEKVLNSICFTYQKYTK